MPKLIVGYPRSATNSLVVQAQHLGLSAVAERSLVPSVFSLYQHTLYNLQDPPGLVKNIVKARLDMGFLDFEVVWMLSPFVYLLQQAIPELEIFILIRDPKDACNSFRAMKKRKPEYFYLHVRLWNSLYESLCVQAEAMNPTPKLLHFDKVIQGAYSMPLFGVEGLPPHENPQGAYLKFDHKELPKSYEIKKRLESICEELV